MFSNAEKFSLSVRKRDWYLESFSDAAEFHELLVLVERTTVAAPVVVHNFAPVIEHLNQLRFQHEQQQIENAYTSLFITWQDASTYEDKDILMGMQKELIKQSTGLISSLKSHLEVAASSLASAQGYAKIQCARQLAETVHLYITALLCFTHSKATLQVSSFKKETALTSLAVDLLLLIRKFYLEVLGYQGEERGFSRDSLLYALAMNQHEELPSFLGILPTPLSSADLRLQYLDLYVNRSLTVLTNQGQQDVIGVTWARVDDGNLEIAKILRNVLKKVGLVVNLIETLKNEDVQWTANESLATTLVQAIEGALQEKLSTRGPRRFQR